LLRITPSLLLASGNLLQFSVSFAMVASFLFQLILVYFPGFCNVKNVRMKRGDQKIQKSRDNQKSR